MLSIHVRIVTSRRTGLAEAHRTAIIDSQVKEKCLSMIREEGKGGKGGSI